MVSFLETCFIGDENSVPDIALIPNALAHGQYKNRQWARFGLWSTVLYQLV